MRVNFCKALIENNLIDALDKDENSFTKISYNDFIAKNNLFETNIKYEEFLNYFKGNGIIDPSFVNILSLSFYQEF